MPWTRAWNGTVRFWDLEVKAPSGAPLPRKGSVHQLVFSPDGKVLAAVMDADWKTAEPGLQKRAAEIHFWDVAARRPVRPPLEHWGEPPRIAYTSEGLLTVTAHDGVTQTWDPATGQPVGEAWKGEWPVPESHSPDGRYVLKGRGEDNTCWLIDVRANRLVGEMQPAGGVGFSAFSADSGLVATAGAPAWLWEVATVKPVGPPLGQANVVAFSPDGRWLLTGGDDGNVRLWPVPAPVEGDVKRLKLWVELVAGAELAGQARRVLKSADCLRRQERLEELGGIPDRP